MSDEPNGPTRLWIVLLPLLLAIACVARVTVTVQHQVDSGAPARASTVSIERQPWTRELAQIALAEVKRREGWSGKADQPSAEGDLWYVVVRRKAGATTDWRCITLRTDGKIINYEVRTDPPL
jgi:hypothetical protein